MAPGHAGDEDFQDPQSEIAGGKKETVAGKSEEN